MRNIFSFSEEIFSVVLIYILCSDLCVSYNLYFGNCILYMFFYILVFSNRKFWYRSAKIKTFCHVIHYFKRYC